MIKRFNKKAASDVDLTGFIRVDGALCLSDGYVMTSYLDNEKLDSFIRYTLASALNYSISEQYEHIALRAEEGSHSAQRAKQIFEQNLGFIDFIKELHELVDSLNSHDDIAAILIPMLVSAQAVFNTDIIDSCKICRIKGIRVPVGYGAELLHSCQIELVQLLSEGMYTAINEAHLHHPVLVSQANTIKAIAAADYAENLSKQIKKLSARTINVQQQLIEAEEQRKEAEAKKKVRKVSVDTMLRNAAKRVLPNETATLLKELVSGQYESWREISSLLNGNEKTHDKNIKLHDLLDDLMDNQDFDINSCDVPKQVQYVSQLLSIADKYDARANCGNCQLIDNFFGDEPDTDTKKEKMFCRYTSIFQKILTEDEYDRACKDAGFEPVDTFESWNEENEEVEA